MSRRLYPTPRARSRWVGLLSARWCAVVFALALWLWCEHSEAAVPVANPISIAVARNSSETAISPNVAGSSTSVDIAGLAVNGTARVGTDKLIYYTPAYNYVGTDTFSYTVSNADGTSAPAMVTVTVNPSPPVAVDSSSTVAANSTANVMALALSGGEASSLNILSTTTHGTLVVTGATATYTPAADYYGADAFSYTAVNAGGVSLAAKVSITVNPPPPIANDVYAYASGVLPVTILPNVTGVFRSVVRVLYPSHGTVWTTQSTSFSYLIEVGYSGTDFFTYTATNAGGTSAPATVYINVDPAVPMASSRSVSVAANSSANALALSLKGGVATSVAMVSQPSHGTATTSGASINYTPTAGYSGVDALSYTASNASGTSSAATVSITVTAPTLSLSPSSLVGGKVGTAYSQALSASLGTAPYSYTVSAGSLPAGLSLSPEGLLSGTPTADGSFGFTVKAMDSYGATGTQSYVLVINIPAPAAAAVSLKVAANSSAKSVALNLSGGAASSVAVATQPSHGTATVSGMDISYMPTPGYSGADTFTYTASNDSGTSSPATVSITVTAPTLGIGPDSLDGGQVGLVYSQALSASLGTAPYSYTLSAGSLPQGLSLNTTGLLSGTPMASGSFSFTVQATDSYGATGIRSYTLDIAIQAPVAGDASATVAANSSANAVTLNLSGGAASSVAVVTKPGHGTVTVSGMGIIYTPTVGYSGADSLTYTASNVSGTSAAATVRITVTAPTLGISPTSLAGGMVGASYRQVLSASLGTAPYTYAVNAGSLPGGLSLSEAGVLGGTPTASGSFSFTVQATDSYGATGTRSYALDIAIQAPVAGDTSATVAANSSANAVTLNLSGGAASSVAVVTKPHHGTATVSGMDIRYTPVAGYSGADAFTYMASNGSGSSAAAAVTMTVIAPVLSITPWSLEAGTVNTAYSQTLAAGLGTAPYRYALSAGTLPGGLSLSEAGVLSGTPMASGSFSFTVHATDSYGATGTRSYTLDIAIQAPVAGNASATVAANSSAKSVALNLSGGAASSVAVVSQPSHGTARVSGVGISYMPTAGYSGADAFTYTASNTSGTSSAATVSITVTPATLSIKPVDLEVGEVGAVYNQEFHVSLGTAPYTYSLTAGSLPSGMALGSISGTPTESGTFSFTVQATDVYGATGSQSYSLSIVLPLPEASDSSQSVMANSNATQISLSLSGGAADSVTVVQQPAHGTAAASGTSISYTPTAGYSGADAFTYTASNTSGTSAAATVSVSVLAPTLTIKPSSLDAGMVGTAYSASLSASLGTAPYHYAVASGSLPGGLSLGGDGTLAGTPMSSGNFSFSILASDVYGATGTQSYVLFITPLPVPVATASSFTVSANSKDNQAALNIMGTADSVTVATQATHGMATASGASISYTPTAGYSGADAFTYTASNTSGTSAAAMVSVTVTAPILMLRPSTLITGMVGSVYKETLSALDGTAPYAYVLSSGNLPGGLSLGSDGVLTGTPTVSGNFGFSVQARDAYGATGTQSYVVSIAALPLPVATASSFTVLANSKDNQVALSITGMTDSVAVASQATHGTATASGASISYTPMAGYSGADAFTYTATNISGTSAAATVGVTVTAPTLMLRPSTLITGMVGAVYKETLTALQGTAPYAYVLSSGNLPEGLSLGGDGVLTGTPTVSGNFDFSIQARDAYGATGAQSYALFIAPLPAPVANASNLTVLANSKDNQVALSITGTAASVAVASQASHGMAMASGASISYTPTAGYSGADAFTYTASNLSGTSAAATVSVSVLTPVLRIASSLPAGTVGMAYSYSLSASLGTEPYTYTLASGSLPAGIGLSVGGALTGTPTVSGSFNFTIQARDVYAATGTQSYGLFIAPLPVPEASSSAITVQANSSDNLVTLPLAGGEAASVAVASQAAHGTATVSGTTIRYTPTAGYSGADAFAYTASNSSGTSAAATVTVTVSPPTLRISPGTLPPGMVGTAYGEHLNATLGTKPYVYALASGSLPAGLSLSNAGMLSGIPTTNDVFDFTAQATDAYGATGTQRYSVSIAIQAPIAGAVNATVAANSQDNPVALNLSGGAAASLAVTQQAVHGVAVVNGNALSYTPTAGYSGQDFFTYTASNASGASSAVVTITVIGPVLQISPAAGPLPEATEGKAYSLSLSASGGSPPYSYALSSGALPAGLTLSTSGLMAGTPAAGAAGRFSFSIGVKDVYEGLGQASYTLAVGQMLPVAPSLSVTLAPEGTVELDVSSGATGAPFTAAAVQSLTPANAGQASIRIGPSAQASQGPSYLLRFTSGRGFSGTAVVVYTLSNTAGTSAPAQIRIQVLARSDPSKDAEVAGTVAAQTQSASRFASAQISNVATRLESLHADGWGRSDFGLRLNTGSQAASSQAMPDAFPLAGYQATPHPSQHGYGLYASQPNLPDLPASSQTAATARQALAFWVGGSLEYGRQYVRGAETEYRFTSSGISAGGDWRVNDLFTLGLGFGLGRDSALIGVNGSKSVANSQSMVLYGSLRPAKQVFVDGLLGYGRLRFDSTRYITDGSGLAVGTRTGRQMFAALVGGMEFREAGWMWSPYLRLELSRSTLDTYSESAPGLAALTYFAQQASALSGVLGVRAEGVYALGTVKLAPKLRLEYTHSLQRTGEAQFAYADLADLGPAYSLAASSTRSGNWTLGLGLRIRWRSGVELSVDLNSSIDIHSNRSQGLSLGLRVPF
ncbi:MAG: tandem-95 repeat protein [Acidovorax sp.]|nr:tandem-95 repeat protein [Acidovorax sp.]